jgi:hypothetical protein
MKLTVNLVTRRPLDKATVQKICLFLGGVLVLWFVIILITAITVTLRHRKVLDQLTQLSAGVASVPGDETLVGESRVEAAKIEQILERRAFRWSRILNHLENTWIDGIQVRSIEPDFEKKTLGLTVLAKNDEVFRRYLEKLIGYEGFSQVLLLRQANTDIKNAGGRTFSVIRCELRIRGGF